MGPFLRGTFALVETRPSTKTLAGITRRVPDVVHARVGPTVVTTSRAMDSGGLDVATARPSGACRDDTVQNDDAIQTDGAAIKARPAHIQIHSTSTQRARHLTRAETPPYRVPL